MLERFCPKCKVPMNSDYCIKESCKSKTVSITTLYWCKNCNIPIFDKNCACCGSQGEYISTDIRPVFPEERLLLGIILDEKDILKYMNKSVWNFNGAYIVDGKKIRVTISKLNKKPLDEIKKMKATYDKYKNNIDYTYFYENIDKFVNANKNRFNEIVDEAVVYIQGYKKRYSLDSMFVSFSGGKDSTVTSDLVVNAFATKKIVHIFGDTTLEFDLTYDYKNRFAKNEKIRVITAKNREKDFNELCKIVGPPSRVMRWCCTVFKTGAISKKILSVFKNKTNVLTFYGIRKSESISRSKYERESSSPKISKQTVVSPIIEWTDFDVWLYILTRKIDFNDAYKLGFSRVGCWCCPNNGAWSEFLSKFHMYEKYTKWRDMLVEFAKSIGKPDAEEYVDSGNWKARQGGNGLEISKKIAIPFEPCATEENAFNYELQRPISEELYEFFKPFGYINKELGNKRLGEVYIIDKNKSPVLVLQGRIGSNKLKVTIKKKNIAKAKTIDIAEKRIQCQITKYQLCLACRACESVCKHDAIKIYDDNGNISYKIDDKKCVRCSECVAHYNAGCYMRKVVMVRKDS